MQYKLILEIDDGYGNVQVLLVALFQASGEAIICANALNQYLTKGRENQKYKVVEIKKDD